MKHILALLTVLWLAHPGVAFAHASPVEYIPASSATVTEAPETLSIRFSERVEPGASRITVKDGAGNELQQGVAVVDSANAHILSTSLTTGTQGAYVVTWSVVSSDDGHFTKGGYTYFIGDTASAGSETAPQVEVVQLSALPEATVIAVELLGNSLLLGALVLFAFVIRPRMREMSIDVKRKAVSVHTWLLASGVSLGLIGAFSHVLLKTFELAGLHSISFIESLPLYLGTVSGSATLIRAGAIVLFVLFFLFRRHAIRAAERFTVSEVILVILLGVFAYFRALVSHATANPFHPEISIAVNFLHLIGKDLSAGILAGLVALLLVKTLRPHMPELLRSGMRLLTILFGLTGVTAAYIVWLHLKDPMNLAATLWGERFMPLLASAIIATALLAYHVIGNRLRPTLVGRFLPYTLPAEFLSGVAIVFFSSLMIITSPPLEGGQGKEFREENNGVDITLFASPYEDDKALLTFRAHGETNDPTILLDVDEDGGIVINGEKRFPGGYVLPLALFDREISRTVSIIVPQENGYDAHALFSVSKGALIGDDEEGKREFDVFAFVMLVIGIVSIAAAFLLYRIAIRESWQEVEQGTLPRILVGMVVMVLVGSQLLGGASLLFANEFKRECVADGNSWHLMLPARDGRPVSSTPAEGCMALNGAFHVPDRREYAFLKAPGASSVKFVTDLSLLRAGVPEKLQFSIQNEDGTPVRLSAVHERFVHVIVISKDASEFFHVHPDDTESFSQEAIQNATFTVPFTFPKGGKYIIGLDYASGLSPRSEQFQVTVDGAPSQNAELTMYPLHGSVDGYEVTLQPGFLVAGQNATLIWRIQKDREDVLDMAPYLGAALHVALVKDDLSEFVHAHGEVHLPGATLPKVSATGVHNHAPPPPRFGPMVEAHTVFPTPGIYTVFAQFKHEGKVVNAPFTLKVE